MLDIPTIETKVDGFAIEVKANVLNLASGDGDQGSHLLEDGFLHVTITCDGTNPFWPERYEETILVARLKHPGNMPDVVSEYELCLLQTGDELTKLRLEETAFQGHHHGIWFFADCTSPAAAEHGGTLAYGTIIQATAETIQGETALH